MTLKSGWILVALESVLAVVWSTVFLWGVFPENGTYDLFYPLRFSMIADFSKPAAVSNLP